MSDLAAPKSVTVEEMAEEEDDVAAAEAAIEERWSLYEAYNELHALAQELETPFEAPAVLVVGQQTDGKSALVEALMGFQFNHVGGGTKTRRPITLHMKYDPQCQFPLCHLGSDDDPSVAFPKSLSQIQVLLLFPLLQLLVSAKFWEILTNVENQMLLLPKFLM